MGLTADQQRIKSLLTETITLLCKNGLHFKTEFCIEGLLGITLDRDNVFLININETIRTDARSQIQTVSRTSTSTFLNDSQSGSADSNFNQHQLVAVSDSHHISEDESCEQLPSIPSIQPSSNEVVVYKSKQVASRKRHHSASRSSSCSDFSLERDQSAHGIEFRQISAVTSDVTNSSVFHRRLDCKPFMETNTGSQFSHLPDSSAHKQALLCSEENSHRDDGHIDQLDSSRCDRSSFDIINIKEESDDELEFSVSDAHKSMQNHQHTKVKQSTVRSNRECEHLYGSPSGTGCSSWTSNRNLPANSDSFPVVIIRCITYVM